MEGPYLSPEDGPRGAHPPRARDRRRASTTSTAARTPRTAGSCWSRWRRKFPARCRSSNIWSRPACAWRSGTPRRRRGRSPTPSPPARRSRRISATAARRCCPGIRTPIWELLAADAVLASLIVDGHHLPPATVKAMVRAQGRRPDDPRHRRDRRRRLRAGPVYDRRRRVRARRRRPRLAAGHAVSRRLEPDARPRDRQHGPLHRPADRRGDSDGVDDPGALPRDDDPPARSPPTGTRRGATARPAASTFPTTMNIATLDWAVIAAYFVIITAIGLVVG